MLELEIVPGKSLGRFQIGMSISTAIGVIKELNKYIKKADIIYSEEVSYLFMELLENL